ncbi:MAG TPA: O-antigen ligase family protein, partial [Elusimicrobiota bacterium]|nr:O-antigen ligase family protein [Elusimicrobiota bacterium]
ALSWAPSAPDRAISSLGTPVALGAYLAVCVSVSVAVARAGRARLGWTALALAAAALALTGSRGPALAAAAGAAAAGVGAARRRVPHQYGVRHPVRVPRAAWLAAAAAACVLAWALARRTMAQSDAIRGQLWATAWEAFLRRPLLGWGTDAFAVPFRLLCGPAYAFLYRKDGVATHAHDDWLQVLATMGVAGAAAYAWLHAAAWRALRSAAARPATSAAAGALAALFVSAKFNSPSLCAAWLGAALAGAALPEGPARGEGRARALLAPGLLLACSLWTAASALAWVRADRQDLLGRLARAQGRPREAAERFEAAAALLPGVFVYRHDLANVLFDVARGAEPAARRIFLARAADAAREGLSLRPSDPDLYRLLARAELRRAETGEARLPAARAALDAAEALDPAFPRLGELSRIPLLQGDEEMYRRLKARID